MEFWASLGVLVSLTLILWRVLLLTTCIGYVRGYSWSTSGEWFGSGENTLFPCHLGEHIEAIERDLHSIRPTSEITPKPRKLTERHDWKGKTGDKFYLTNKEASPVICSVVISTQEADIAQKKCRGNTRCSRVFFLLLECSIRFLSALQQNRSRARLLYLFYNKEFLIFPHAFD